MITYQAKGKGNEALTNANWMNLSQEMNPGILQDARKINKPLAKSALSLLISPVQGPVSERVLTHPRKGYRGRLFISKSRPRAEG